MTTTDELPKQLDYLKIRGLAESWADYVKAGEKAGMGHERFLRHVVAESYAAKRAYAREMRLLRAKIPEMLSANEFWAKMWGERQRKKGQLTHERIV